MASSETGNQGLPSNRGWFTTTHWSVVLEAGQKDRSKAMEALERLCQTYWYPLYYFIRKYGHNHEEAQDLTQGFFAWVLERQLCEKADRAQGKFRSFLIGCLKNYLNNETARAKSLKRGGGHTFVSLDDTANDRYGREPVDDRTPEKAFERRWVLALLEQALNRLRQECATQGKSGLIKKVARVVSGDKEGFSYALAAQELGMTEAALRSAVARLRQRYGQILESEIAQTVAHPKDLEEEIRHLFQALE